MPNVFDYLDWRGDLDFDQSPFNAVDSLILCCLAYVRLDGLVPEGAEQPVTIKQAVSRFFAQPQKERQTRTTDDERLMQLLARGRRFSRLELSRYVSKLDPVEEKQFAAVTISLEDAGYYLAFRGTDSTITGWKEDFNMSFLPQVPAQAEALAYLEDGAAVLQGRLLTGGHSKGGNLAVYAAAKCKSSVQNRLHSVYNNDGPGFSQDMLHTPGYRSVQAKVHTFVPQSSIVGMLLEHEEDYTVVQSSQFGVMQHDPYSWQVLGADFVRMQRITSASRVLDQTLKKWVAGMSMEQREKLVNGLFSVFPENSSGKLGDRMPGWLKGVKEVSRAWRDADDGTRELLQRALTKLLDAAKSTAQPALPEHK